MTVLARRGVKLLPSELRKYTCRSLPFRHFSMMAVQSEKPHHFNDWPNTQGVSMILIYLMLILIGNTV
jgi:hypothetical protein